jgi:UDP-N-acetylbacillosamine N-acetyltransferase
VSISKSIYIFGYSGHSYVVLESILDLGYTIKGYFDIEKATQNPFDIDYIGFEKDLRVKDIIGDDFVFPTIGDNKLRFQVVQLFNNLHLNQLSIIDPTALVSKTAVIGKSTYVGKGTVVNSLTIVGDGVILNSGSIVEHECTIAENVHIAPGSTICGSVKIEKNAFIGANSVVLPNLRVADNVVIGAGSVLTKSIISSSTWMGNPARIKD